MSEVPSDLDQSLAGSGADELSETEEIDEADLEEAEDSSDEGANDYFDLEAAESDGDDADDVSTESDDGPVYFFPQFSRLPIELRTRIWEFFDPDMRATARIFEFVFPGGQQMDIWESATLDEQTTPARAILATHRESRALALRFYPDEARFRKGHSLIRCRKETDIILLQGYSADYSDCDWATQIPLFAGVKHVAFTASPSFIHPQALSDLGSGAYPIFKSLPDLHMIYYCLDAASQTAQSLGWYTTDAALKFHVHTHEEGESGVGEASVEFLYCWPNPAINRASIEDVIPCSPVLQLADGHEVWPMMRFTFDDGMKRYDRICKAYVAEGEWDDNYSSASHDSSEPSSDENEYESEGIDDGTTEESESASNDDDDMVLQESSQHDDASAFGGFSPIEGEPGGPAIDHNLMAANFSSLEPESPGADDADDADDLVYMGRSVHATQRPKRHVVTDSEDESGSDGVQEDVNIRQPGRRARAILSDSEDEDAEVEEVVRPAGRRSRVVLSDSEDDDDESDGVGLESTGVVVPLKNHEVDSAQESGSDEDDEDESSETEPETRKLSLAERLQLFRSENPAGSDLDSDAEAGEMDNDDGDDAAHDLTNFPDDEDGEDQSGNDVGLDMAEDEFEDEEDEW
jgi:hypothetical protein